MRRIVAFHRWLGLLTAILVVVPAVTAILMNHRGWLESAPTAPSGPFDQYVLCTAAEAGGRIWLGTSEGLWRSDDGGRTFTIVTLPVPAKQVNSVALGRRVVYVGLRYSGVLRSDDGGATWRALALPPGDGDVSGVAVAPDGAVLVATEAGMRRFGGDGASALMQRPPAPPASGNAALRLVYDLHDGRFWGRWGVWVTDAASLAIVLLAASGLVMFARMRRPRRRGGDEEPPGAGVKKTSP